jgi:tetratricopeptide (TPR) repeat protein
MNSGIVNDLAKAIFQKNSLQECSLNELQQLSNKYSYSSSIQLLLTQKLKEENHNQYNKQLEKLSLYIQPSPWLEQLLVQQGNMITHKTVKETEPFEAVEKPIEQPAPASDVVTIVEEPAIEIPEIKTEPVLNTSELTFEPYHTVDYFASQGIRMKEEGQPKDKLGLQLKSFTEWLKTMKRLPVAEVAAAVDSRSEQKVEQLAEHSITDREVLTEAMAEVWAKQGNSEKAITTYRKLSLLDPSKSSYFAAKIDQLKTT